MKKPYLLFVFILSIVFLVNAKSLTEKLPISTNKANYYLAIDQKGIIKSHDTIILKKVYKVYYLPIKLFNNTSAPLNYITMTCGWDELFHLSNKHFEILGWGCDRNFPIVRGVLPFKAETFFLPIIKKQNSNRIEGLKIGMNLFIANKQNRNIFSLPVDKMNNVIWSSEVFLPI